MAEFIHTAQSFPRSISDSAPATELQPPALPDGDAPPRLSRPMILLNDRDITRLIGDLKDGVNGVVDGDAAANSPSPRLGISIDTSAGFRRALNDFDPAEDEG